MSEAVHVFVTALRQHQKLANTVRYAVGNILLTSWGPVIVAMLR